MSFILDALRKSEGERQREEAPSLARVPLAVAKNGIPAWTWIVIGCLGVSVVALAGLWLQRIGAHGSELAPEPSSAQARELARASEHDEAEPVPSPLAAPAVAPPAPTDQRLQAGGPPATVAEAGGARAALIDDAALAQPSSSAAAAGTSGGNLRVFRSVAEMIAAGISIPPVTFELHVFDADPSKRSVFFSGSAYREGQRIKDGPLIVEITAEGVILDQAGRRLLLRSQ